MLFHIPTYPSGIWSFQIAVNGDLDVTEPNEKALAEFQRPHALKYYNTEVHRAAFALPNYVKEMLNE